MPRPALVRYAGLAGSLSLAVAAWFGGATNPWEPTIRPASIFAGDDGVLVPLAWLVGIVLLVGAWVAGVRVAGGQTSRWAYVTAALWSLPLLAFLPLGSYDAYSYACQGWQQGAGLDPYAGGVDLLGCPWADAVAPTWRDAPAPYGPLFLLLAALAAKTGSLAGTLAGLRVIALLGVVLIAVALPVLARRGNVPLSRAVWLVLACPLVPIHLISGAHNDALMVGLFVAGLACAIKQRGWAAGLLLGLAIAVKATAVVVAPFALLLLLTRRRQAELVGGAVLALAATTLVSGRGFGWVTALAGSGISVQWTSPPTAVGMTIDLFGPDAVPVTRIIGIVALAIVLALLFFRARSRDPLLYAGYALAATVLLAPVFHPWYAVWPLAVLAATLHHHLRWLVVPCAVASALCLPDGYNLALAVKSQGAVAMTALLVYLLWKTLYEAKNRTGRRRGPDHTPDRLSRRDA
ncbi:polyprenol phosphomannose-dependent alpha 1,6 mannosyltransferase MptB [Actinoplanes solisilvae]|uniref:polyprenol phosphomannose-dependent alpha 1,6 mannosyltransferase MptB n=1 Tax=Actinoplanes solisilvae TaxID=2486853 RepID=UPI000FD95F9C|nr:polyprenol phosphomannose-dependent alpha 1,6 mannosyltransferase MptB [Actinoplanes solisilvae]